MVGINNSPYASHMLPTTFSAFTAGMTLSLSLMIAIGPQNAHLLRVGLQRQHLWLSVLVCALADVALISVGVVGLAQLGQLSDRVYGALLGATICVLLIYGWQAARRFGQSQRQAATDAAPTALGGMSRKQAVTTALTFSWLNPHAWIDTAVLIGGASLAYQAEARAGFSAGAMVGSVLWFVALGTLACWLGTRLGHSTIWRWIDGLVALMMWSIAATLAGRLVL